MLISAGEQFHGVRKPVLGEGGRSRRATTMAVRKKRRWPSSAAMIPKPMARWLCRRREDQGAQCGLPRGGGGQLGFEQAIQKLGIASLLASGGLESADEPTLYRVLSGRTKV